LDRDGRYLRTVLPYPANTPRERAASLGQLEIDGERLPVVFDGTAHTLAPLTRWMLKQNMAFNPQGYVVMVSGNEWKTPRHLLALHAEGGARADVDFVGPRIAAGPSRLASSSSTWL